MGSCSSTALGRRKYERTIGSKSRLRQLHNQYLSTCDEDEAGSVTSDGDQVGVLEGGNSHGNQTTISLVDDDAVISNETFTTAEDRSPFSSSSDISGPSNKLKVPSGGCLFSSSVRSSIRGPEVALEDKSDKDFALETEHWRTNVNGENGGGGGGGLNSDSTPTWSKDLVEEESSAEDTPHHKPISVLSNIVEARDSECDLAVELVDSGPALSELERSYGALSKMSAFSPLRAEDWKASSRRKAKDTLHESAGTKSREQSANEIFDDVVDEILVVGDDSSQESTLGDAESIPFILQYIPAIPSLDTPVAEKKIDAVTSRRDTGPEEDVVSLEDSMERNVQEPLDNSFGMDMTNSFYLQNSKENHLSAVEESYGALEDKIDLLCGQLGSSQKGSKTSVPRKEEQPPKRETPPDAPRRDGSGDLMDHLAFHHRPSENFFSSLPVQAYHAGFDKQVTTNKIVERPKPRRSKSGSSLIGSEKRETSKMRSTSNPRSSKKKENRSASLSDRPTIRQAGSNVSMKRKTSQQWRNKGTMDSSSHHGRHKTSSSRERPMTKAEISMIQPRHSLQGQLSRSSHHSTNTATSRRRKMIPKRGLGRASSYAGRPRSKERFGMEGIQKSHSYRKIRRAGSIDKNGNTFDGALPQEQPPRRKSGSDIKPMPTIPMESGGGGGGGGGHEKERERNQRNSHDTRSVPMDEAQRQQKRTTRRRSRSNSRGRSKEPSSRKK